MKIEPYRNRLFRAYRKTHGDNCINSQEANTFFELYYNCYFRKYFNQYDKDASILEIGCNAGYMLEIFDKHGYKDITGIDLSPDDIEYANKRLGGGKCLLIDAFDYLSANTKKFDIIYSRAVMEHISKDKILEFLELINNSLIDGGIALIEVPNMDWIWASHERYMDFTHEVGFTKESLRQVMRSFFDNVRVEYTNDSKRYRKVKILLARMIIGSLLYWAEPCIPKEAFWGRCILGVGEKCI